MKICIDAGHGGADSGAVGPSLLREKDVNLKVALYLGEILSNNGIEVVYTRKNDDMLGRNSNESLRKRVEIANQSGADYFVSIHCNSAENSNAQGSEVFIYTVRSKAKNMAEEILNKIAETMGFAKRGVKTANFYVIRNTNMPACLVEIAFISNPREEAVLGDDKMQQKIALAIAKGIGSALGINIMEFKKGRVIAKSGLNVRKGPSTQSPILKAYKFGEIINIYSMLDGWYKTDDGWVFGRYVEFLK